eukprot:2785423-Prymnesium_polylepis.3
MSSYAITGNAADQVGSGESQLPWVGTTDGTPPSPLCAWRMLRRKLAWNGPVKKLNCASSAASEASPIHPRRSSRCGQSVGMETMLARADMRTFSWTLLSKPPGCAGCNSVIIISLRRPTSE